MGRNKYVCCEVCSKNVRSDKPHTHKENKYRMKSCSVCHKTMIAGHLSRHMKIHEKSKQNILDNIKKDQEHFNQQQETGQVVEELLKNNNIDPRSLRSEYSKALATEMSYGWLVGKGLKENLGSSNILFSFSVHKEYFTLQCKRD